MKRLIYLSVFLFLSALACSTTSIAASLVPSGGVLYQDYFSDPKSGWGEMNKPAGQTGYIKDTYHIFVNKPDTNIWTHPGKDYSDVRLEVSLLPVSGTLSNRMGLICRLKDDKNFYFFVISADGFYGIGKVKAGQATLLSGSEMLPSESILTGNQINQVRADCAGDKLSFYANGKLLASVNDKDFSSGDVGILAGTFDLPNTDVYFDNFVAYKP